MTINFFDTDTQACPYDAYQTLRSEAPAYRCPLSGMYIITRFDDVKRVLTDAKNFTNQLAGLASATEPTPRQKKVNQLFRDEGWLPAATLAGRDDPNHKQMRAMFNEAFRPAKINELDPEVQDLAYSLLDDFIDEGRCDWVRQFAVPLPLIIICKQMGADLDDMWQIKEWTEAFFRRISMMQSEEDELDSVRQQIESQHYFQPIFGRLRKSPDNSLLSELVNREIEEWGRPLNDNELHAEMMADTFVGGSETTTNAISAGMKMLIENKNIWDMLKSDRDRYLKNFIEEVLRLESPVQGLMRATAEDVEISGTVIPKGSLVNVRYAAANRDEEKFAEPEAINLERKAAGGHMAFGSGSHHCLGAPLARRELFWSFNAMLDRIEDAWFAPEQGEFTYHPHYLLRSLTALHIEFKAQ